MKILDGYELNEPGDPSPWSPRELQLHENIISKLGPLSGTDTIPSLSEGKQDKQHGVPINAVLKSTGDDSVGESIIEDDGVNVGISVTPEVWHEVFRVLRIGVAGALRSHNTSPSVSLSSGLRFSPEGNKCTFDGASPCELTMSDQGFSFNSFEPTALGEEPLGYKILLGLTRAEGAVSDRFQANTELAFGGRFKTTQSDIVYNGGSSGSTVQVTPKYYVYFQTDNPADRYYELINLVIGCHYLVHNNSSYDIYVNNFVIQSHSVYNLFCSPVTGELHRVW